MNLQFLFKKLNKEISRSEKVIYELKRLSAKECYRITLTPSRDAGAPESRLGGTPYVFGDYPVDSRGNRMLFLCQLRLEDIGKKGLLQFFISPDGRCECKTVFCENPDESLMQKAEPAESSFNPVRAECRITLEKAEDYISVSDIHFEALLATAVKNALGSELKGDMYSFFTEEECKKICTALSGRGSKLFGYPCFTQCDFRSGDSDEILLLQLDSDIENETPLIMWGDSGQGGFFITPADFENGNFENVSFCWDCY